MHFSTAVVALVAALTPILEVTASPVPQSSTNSVSSYTSRLQRKEWRKLTKTEQTAYINAVKCLQTKPAAKKLRGAQTLYDSFPATHLDLVDTPNGDSIHIVAQFLPWHRYFLFVHETILRNVCGYKGAQPYWNWSLDNKALSKSPVFDNTYGFGGNGTAPKKVLYPYTTNKVGFQPPVPAVIPPKGNCVSGPFSSYTLHVGPGNYTVDHCLARNIQDNNPTLTEGFSQKFIDTCIAKTNYLDMWLCLELGIGYPGNEDFHINGPHAAPHIAVGEELMNMATSPNDPLFMLHHANLDRLWDMWQKKDAKARTFQIMGGANPQQTANATLDTPLLMQGLAVDKTVRFVMNSTALNYEYVV